MDSLGLEASFLFFFMWICSVSLCLLAVLANPAPSTSIATTHTTSSTTTITMATTMPSSTALLLGGCLFEGVCVGEEVRGREGVVEMREGRTVVVVPSTPAKKKERSLNS